MLSAAAAGSALIVVLALGAPGLRRALAPSPAAATSPAPEDPDPAPTVPGWIVGDLHVHVSPPDAPGHSTLHVTTAIAGARRNALDFMVVTPHDAHFMVSAGEWGGDRSLTGQDAVSALATRHLAVPRPEDGKNGSRPLLVVSGWEWTRDDPGHLGIAFADVASLAATKEEARAARAVKGGALVVVNHPFFGPVESSLPVMKMLKTDRRWRPFAGLGADDGQWNAIEVWHDRSVWVEKMHAQLVEEYPATQMVRAALQAWDVATLSGRRRITAVGGSDAHGKLPYSLLPMAMTSVYVDEASEEGLRRGLLGARVTFGTGGGAAARDFAATSDVPGASAVIGGSLPAKQSVTLTWSGKARLVENGADVGEFEGGTTRRLGSPGAFAFWRIEKEGDAFSNMIYANLP